MSIFKKRFGRESKKAADVEAPGIKAFIEGSMEGLQILTGAHQRMWQFGEEEYWEFSQDTGELVFTFPDKIVRALAQIIGTFDSEAGTWMWSWANPSISEYLTRDAVRVRDYGKQYRIPQFTSEKWPAEEIDCWHMAAVACRICGSNGAYRGPSGTTYVFFTFGEAKIKKSNSG